MSLLSTVTTKGPEAVSSMAAMTLALLPMGLKSKLNTPQVIGLVRSLTNVSMLLRNIIFLLFLLKSSQKTFYHIKGYGLVGSVVEIAISLRKLFYSLLLKTPSVRKQVQEQVRAATTELERKLVVSGPEIIEHTVLPSQPLTTDQVNAELDVLTELKRTRWEDGKVSGAVYHGGADLLKIQAGAMERFGVSNPIHPDVFPGVRKMEAEIVSMVLHLFNAPVGGAGAMTSGGTESILLACYSARQRGFHERGIKEPEMIIPSTAHAAFVKASGYFKIKLHVVPCPEPSYRVDVAKVKRLINPNTVLIVGSAPNFPHGVVDEIPALSRLAKAHNLNLHVDCCLGSFLMPYLKKAGFPSPWEEQGGFDFRLPGVTSISVDTHKYGFAPKGSSVVLYREARHRTYQYFIYPDWSGGVYASPSMAGSRPGALIAGCWASMVSVGESGYIESCRQIVGAAKSIESTIRQHPALTSTLKIIGQPLVSVVAFESIDPAVYLYDIADGMSGKGWHLNAMQDPPAMHVAVTLPMVPHVQNLIDDLVKTIAELKVKYLEEAKEAHANGTVVQKKRGDASALYGVAGALPDKTIVKQLAEGFMDTLYKV